MPSKKNKPRYDPPAIYPMDEVIAGSGYCTIGSNVGSGDNQCYSGQSPQNQCALGNYALKNCFTGNYANRHCWCGTSPNKIKFC